MPGIDDFKGTFPYASEMLGVYQPLLGWRSLQTQRRVDDERKGLIGEVVAGMLADPRLEAAAARVSPMPIDPQDPGDPVPNLPFLWLSEIGSYAESQSRRIRAEEGRPPTAAEWKTIFSPSRMTALLDSIEKRETVVQKLHGLTTESGDFLLFPADALSKDEMKQIRATPLKGSSLMRAEKRFLTRPAAIADESVLAGLMSVIAQADSSLVATLMKPAKRPWETLLPFRDPLATFDPQSQEAVLSPLGLLQLYRQYFFEFETFLGSPVGHVWISPGGTVELIESSTRRTLTERLVEVIHETTTRSELASIEQDELSDAVKEEVPVQGAGWLSANFVAAEPLTAA